MDQRSLQWRVGVVVLSAFLLTGILIVRFSDVSTPFQTAKTLKVRFSQAPGVTKGTPVRKSGILIGRATKVEFIDGSPDVIVTIDITNDRADLHQKEVCQIKTSFLGDAVLEFVPRGKRNGDEEIPAEDLNKPMFDADGQGTRILRGSVVPSPFDMVAGVEDDLSKTLQSVSRAGGEIETLAAKINSLLEGKDPEQFNRILNKTELALESFHTAMTDINDVVGDAQLKEDLKGTIAGMPKMMNDMQSAIASVQRTMTRAENNLENLEGLTEPLGERGEEIARKLDGALGDFEAVMHQLSEFTEGINSDEGTIGQLINNPELYNQISSAARNINEISQDLRPTIKSLEVFADKIARDPGRLGLSGALRKEDRTKYPNYPHVEPPPLDWRLPPKK